MTLVFEQGSGYVYQGSTVIAEGWAGRYAGKNNPALQGASTIGPLPQGNYTIGDWQANHGKLGPMVAPLLPDPANEMFGRFGFYIHGPDMDPVGYGKESEGCIVLPHADRQKVKDTGETSLQVVASYNVPSVENESQEAQVDPPDPNAPAAPTEEVPPPDPNAA